MTNTQTPKSSREVNTLRQAWESAGVINSVVKQQTPTYDQSQPADDKGGAITLEVQEVFNNKGIMHNQG